MPSHIKIVILENHQVYIDNYVMSLSSVKEVKVAGIAKNSEELNELLLRHPDVNVLIMDVQVPVSVSNNAHVFYLTYVQKILNIKPYLKILLISMLKSQVLLKSLGEAGISGYIFKDDEHSIKSLSAVVKNIIRGEKYFSDSARVALEDALPNPAGLTQRQLEILYACAAHPNMTLEELAIHLNIADLTLRNTLSESYARLQVRNKASAIERVKSLGILIP